MHRRKAPCKPSRIGWLFGLLQQPEVLYNHALIDCLAHIVDGQRGHASSGEGLHLDARTVARTGRRGDRHAILADPSLSRCENFMSNPPFFAFQLLSTPPGFAALLTSEGVSLSVLRSYFLR